MGYLRTLERGGSENSSVLHTRASFRVVLAAAFLCAVVGAVSPIALYGAGGRGPRTHNALDYGGVVGCFLEAADTNADGQLSGYEIDAAARRYLTGYERAVTHLAGHRLLALCDADGDGRLTLDELEAVVEPEMGARCLSIDTAEAVAQYMCSRARQADLGYAEYVERYVRMNAIIREQGFAAAYDAAVREEEAAARAAFDTHAGRVRAQNGERFPSPPPSSKNLIGQSLSFKSLLSTVATLFMICCTLGIILFLG